MHSRGIAALARFPEGKSESIRRTPTESGSGQMKFKKKRAFLFGGASGLLLCAMADGALAQDAAAPPTSTQLPEITVTAPSPIVRRKPVVPSRTPTRAARTAPSQNRERAAEPQPTPVAPRPQP